MRKGSSRRRLAVAGLAIWASVAGGAALRAQQNQPIYPAYDGFLKNPDGSYTLAFAYFSHNAAPVTVPPGEANKFGPGAADRQQPTTFLPGHWRFQCVMVVGPEFDGKLVWTLSYGGTTTGTSQRMLQSNWNLVEGAQDLAKIDYAKLPRGVCLNRAPITRVLGASRGSGPVFATTVGTPLSLFGSVHDEGLPRGKTLTTTWKQLSGPGTTTFENASSARTHATFSAPGAYELELSGNDSELSSAARIRVTVTAR